MQVEQNKKSITLYYENSFKATMKKKYLDIIDPIHDFIRVSDSELKIIDNPIFQRLRRIRQLSGAHLTYPSAQHSRFEHSLGVMHIASRAGQTLHEKGILDLDQIDNLRIAALLHDIGHGPFSHLFEEVLQQKKKATHENIGKDLITKTEIGALYSVESMVHSRYQMFKAVYFHKTVRAAEVMLLESIKLADSELGFTSLDLDDYVKLTDDYVVTQLINLTGITSELKRAKKIAQNYQNRDLFKCVYERIFTSKTNLNRSRF